jgi:hypothetical protein
MSSQGGWTEYGITFVWGGVLIAAIQYLINTGHGRWAAILATMPIKDMMLVILNHAYTRQSVLRDMLEADVAVLLGTIAMIVVAKVYPSVGKHALVVSGAIAWGVAATVLVRPPSSTLQTRRGIVLPAARQGYKPHKTR